LGRGAWGLAMHRAGQDAGRALGEQAAGGPTRRTRGRQGSVPCVCARALVDAALCSTSRPSPPPPPALPRPSWLALRLPWLDTRVMLPGLGSGAKRSPACRPDPSPISSAPAAAPAWAPGAAARAGGGAADAAAPLVRREGASADTLGRP
jgi:hypothetical protein